jgi:hypothetical protein
MSDGLRFGFLFITVPLVKKEPALGGHKHEEMFLGITPSLDEDRGQANDQDQHWETDPKGGDAQQKGDQSEHRKQHPHCKFKVSDHQMHDAHHNPEEQKSDA